MGSGGTKVAGGGRAAVELSGHQLLEDRSPTPVRVILRPELVKLDIVAIDGTNTASFTITQVHTIQVMK
jgi:hypothetical protein